jgi:uncharacterized phage protein gp47/JayE
MSDNRDAIQARLLSSVDDSYNKSSGEFIYDALKPVAIELESGYIQIDGILDKAFADTATGKNLDRVVARVGTNRKLTTQSNGIVTINGIVGSSITKGELVKSDGVNFKFTDTNIIPIGGTIDVNVQCTSYGTVGNVPIGAIKYFPKTLAGLQTVTNTSAFTNGYDEETDESLRVRYYAKVQAPVTSSNKNAYKNWALSITGVGGAKIKSLWNGNGTVKVIIINSNKRAADSILITSVKNYIDPNNGDGSGQADIGAICTVISATELAINITVTLTIDTNTISLAQALVNIGTSITSYLSNIAFNQTYVSYAQIGSIILGITGIEDYSNLKVNNGTANITIGDEQVAVIGGVTSV